MRKHVMPLHEQAFFIDALTLMHTSYKPEYKTIGYLEEYVYQKVSEEGCAKNWTLKGTKILTSIRFMDYPLMGNLPRSWWKSASWEWSMQPPLHHALCHQFLYDTLSHWVTDVSQIELLDDYVASGRLGVDFHNASSAHDWWVTMHTQCELYNGLGFLHEQVTLYDANHEEGTLVW